ncbi:MAG TPA: hypothetical protein PKN87_08295 [Syntrophomonadaceae bacterium]|nr:hypothetical protein [Syntrophomonadaceae bacterium]HNX29392.1 hypothetical protein [Syntrophomonadaceae bacterium]HPR93872.1 hypothetical protein [Syntrophomonadaceae bacterium]
MLILLKLLCFAVWLVIMLYLVRGSAYSFQSFSEVKIRIKDEDNLEMNVCRALLKLKKNDRLIIEDASDALQSQRNQVIFKRLLRKNPSLVYSYLRENWSC